MRAKKTKIDNPIKEKDFRPISILPVLSKIYENVILKQLSEYIERTSIYNSTQSGFCKGHSTQTLLLKFRDDIQKALNKNEITMSVLIAYSKAFDTIEHEMLIKKLVNFNFSNSSIKSILATEFHRVVFLALFFLTYTYHHYHHHHVYKPTLFNTQMTLVYITQVLLAIFNRQSKFLKMTYLNLAHGPKTKV